MFFKVSLPNIESGFPGKTKFWFQQIVSGGCLIPQAWWRKEVEGPHRWKKRTPQTEQPGLTELKLILKDLGIFIKGLVFQVHPHISALLELSGGIF